MRAGVRRKKWWQPLARIRINETIGAAFADAHQIGDGDRGVIERQRERRAVEVSAGKNVSTIGEDERIVRGRSRLDFQNVFAMVERAAHRAVNLRHATKAV